MFFSLSRTKQHCITLVAIAALVLFSCAGAFAGSGHGHGHSHGHATKTVKRAILLVAFGTTIPEAKVALDNIDAKVRAAFPETEIRWSYTSKIIRNKLLRESGIDMDSPAEALARLGEEGFSHVAVQSLHTIPGEEFHNLVRTTQAFQKMPKGTRHVTIGAPLLATHDDMVTVTDALLEALPKARKASEAVLFMGHGTHHPGNIYYPGLQYYLWEKDPNTFVGTVEGSPTLDSIIAKLKAKKLTTIWVLPFMSVAGDHAVNDMAGPEEESWKSVLTAEGFTVKTILKGTAEYDAVVDVWVAHLKEAFGRL